MTHKRLTMTVFIQKYVSFFFVFCILFSCSSKHQVKDLIQEGEQFLSENMLDSAQRRFEMICRLDSFNLKALNHLGDIHFKKVEIGKSFRYFTRSIRADSIQPDVYLKLAEIKLMLGKYREVFQTINKAFKINSQLPHGYFMKGVAYKHIGDTTKAISSFKTAIELRHDFSPVYYELGLLLTLKNDSLALPYYENGLRLTPNDVGLKASFAWALDQFNRPIQANKIYFETVRDFPNYMEVKSNYAVFKNKIGEIDTALILCNQLLNKAPRNEKILNLKGIILKRKGLFNEAQKIYDLLHGINQ